MLDRYYGYICNHPIEQGNYVLFSIAPASNSVGWLRKEMLSVRCVASTHFYDDISITLSNNQLTDVYVNLFANNCRLSISNILGGLLKTRVRFIDV